MKPYSEAIVAAEAGANMSGWSRLLSERTGRIPAGTPVLPLRLAEPEVPSAVAAAIGRQAR